MVPNDLFFFYRSLQKVLIARFEKLTGPCDWSKNNKKLVLQHAYPLPINLWTVSTRRFSANQKPAIITKKASDWLKIYA